LGFGVAGLRALESRAKRGHSVVCRAPHPQYSRYLADSVYLYFFEKEKVEEVLQEVLECYSV